MTIAQCAICGDSIKLPKTPQGEAYCTDCVHNAIEHEKKRVAANKLAIKGRQYQN
jgi:predicted nucleic acid-binding Zn ribbon protein